MPKTIEHCHWADAPDMWMPFAPAIKARGGTTVYLSGCTAAPDCDCGIGAREIAHCFNYPLPPG